jgi:D-arabinose 1-dehydrogenase-like Zn-dependent alcohol dehydrogenase
MVPCRCCRESRCAGYVAICLKRLTGVGSVDRTWKDVEEALGFEARGLDHPSSTHFGLENIDRFFRDINTVKLAGSAIIRIAV